MMASGTTGAHPNLDSLLLDGLGIEVTGITVDTYSNGLTARGTDSKVRDGSNTERKSPLHHKSQEVQESVDHSTSSRNGASHHPWAKNLSQDARLDKEL